MNNNRLLWADILRGIGIVLMVLGHIHSTADGFRSFIYAFHMPLFFLVSGYFFYSSGSFVPFLKKKAHAFLIPYFVFGVIYSITKFILNGQDTDVLFSACKAVFLFPTSGMPYESALWFLPSLFFTEIISFWLGKITSARIRSTLVCVLTFLGCFWTSFFSFRLPWALDTSLAAQGFFYIGFLFRAHQDALEHKLSSLSEFPAVLFAVFTVTISIILNGTLNMRTGSWAIIPLTYFNAIAAVWLIYLLSSSLGQKNRFLPTQCLSFIGKYSMTFLCLNHIVIRICKNIATTLFPDLFSWGIAGELILLLPTCCLLALLSLPLEQTSLRILLGKKL